MSSRCVCRNWAKIMQSSIYMEQLGCDWRPSMGSAERSICSLHACVFLLPIFLPVYALRRTGCEWSAKDKTNHNSMYCFQNIVFILLSTSPSRLFPKKNITLKSKLYIFRLRVYYSTSKTCWDLTQFVAAFLAICSSKARTALITYKLQNYIIVIHQ